MSKRQMNLQTSCDDDRREGSAVHRKIVSPSAIRVLLQEGSLLHTSVGIDTVDDQPSDVSIPNRTNESV